MKDNSDQYSFTVHDEFRDQTEDNLDGDTASQTGSAHQWPWPS